MSDIDNEVMLRLTGWLIGKDTGVSSETMVAIYMGHTESKSHFRFNTPWDAWDFGRCVRVVEQIPEIKEAFGKIGKLVPNFKNILENWDELLEVYQQELPNDKFPKLYKLLQKYRGDN